MKAKEQFDEVKRKFDLINTELHDELPALYNSRVLFLITNLQPYFAAEQLFHSESSKVCAYKFAEHILTNKLSDKNVV